MSPHQLDMNVVFKSTERSRKIPEIYNYFHRIKRTADLMEDVLSSETLAI